MDYEKKVTRKIDASNKPTDERPFNAERDRVKPEEWRPSDAPKSPTRVGSGATAPPDSDRRS